jgi:hypothetical protein
MYVGGVMKMMLPLLIIDLSTHPQRFNSVSFDDYNNGGPLSDMSKGIWEKYDEIAVTTGGLFRR